MQQNLDFEEYQPNPTKGRNDIGGTRMTGHEAKEECLTLSVLVKKKRRERVKEWRGRKSVQGCGIPERLVRTIFFSES